MEVVLILFAAVFTSGAPGLVLASLILVLFYRAWAEASLERLGVRLRRAYAAFERRRDARRRKTFLRLAPPKPAPPKNYRIGRDAFGRFTKVYNVDAPHDPEDLARIEAELEAELNPPLFAKVAEKAVSPPCDPGILVVDKFPKEGLIGNIVCRRGKLYQFTGKRWERYEPKEAP